MISFRPLLSLVSLCLSLSREERHFLATLFRFLTWGADGMMRVTDIEGTVRTFLKKWDQVCDKGAKEGKDGYGWIESLDWWNAVAFDVIGDLAFGSPFGMLERDAADMVAITTESGKVIYAPAVKILNERGEFSVRCDGFFMTSLFLSWCTDDMEWDRLRKGLYLLGYVLIRNILIHGLHAD